MKLIYYDGFLKKKKTDGPVMVVRESSEAYCKAEPWRELGVTKEFYEERMAQIQSLTLMDNKLLVKVFEDEACVEELLRVIMDKPDIQVMECHTEAYIHNLYGRSVRLDISARDSDGKLYDVEVQKSNAGAIPKRARYNGALLDADVTNPGDDFQNIPETVVIFITENDVLCGGLPIYHIERTIQETGKLFNDGEHIIYVNASICDDTKLGRLMHDMKCERVEDMDNKVLADRVDYFKNDKRGYYEWWDDIDEWSLRDIEKGRQQGIQEGELLNLISMIGKKLAKGKDIATIADELESEYEEIAGICEVAQRFAPEYNTEAIFEAYSKTRVVA